MNWLNLLEKLHEEIETRQGYLKKVADKETTVLLTGVVSILLAVEASIIAGLKDETS